MYVKLGEHNGGVILNVSEGGLAVQAAIALMDDNVPALRFQLSANKWVQASARIAWRTQSKRTAGLHFNDLSAEARAAITGWLGVERGDFPSKAPADEGNSPSVDVMPLHVIEQAEGMTQEDQKGSIPPTPQEELPSSLTATVSSVLAVPSSLRRDELSEKRMAHESVAPEERLSGVPHTAQALPAKFIGARCGRYRNDLALPQQTLPTPAQNQSIFPRSSGLAGTDFAIMSSRPIQRTCPQPGPSRFTVGFVLGCVLFVAGLVAVRTIHVGTGGALANTDRADAPSGTSAAHRARPVAAAGMTQLPFDTELDLPATPDSFLPSYEPAAIIERVAARYSADARAHHLEGTVHIRAIIGADGVPRGLALVSGDPTLAQIAMDAISLWRYQPATVDGDAVESEVIIAIDFQLPN